MVRGMEVENISASPRGVKRKADDIPLTVAAPRRIKVRTSENMVAKF
jgi:hypothetical protein